MIDNNKLHCIIISILLLILVTNTGSGMETNDGPQPLGPPYEINTNYLVDAITVDGNLNEPVWSNPKVSNTYTSDFGGFSLKVITFHNEDHVFIGVEYLGDTSSNPNDRCEVSFDPGNHDLAQPGADDFKLMANNTMTNDEHSLYYGDGVGGWALYSNEGGAVHPWPAGFAADAELQDNATFEFRIPISEAWGTASPPDGNISGFIIHAFNQAANKHVWWPDNSYDGLNPATEYCDDPSGYGDLKLLGPPYDIDVYYVSSGAMAIDGNLTEPAWTDPSTTVTTTTDTLYGYNLTIYVFHDSMNLFVGVEMLGDMMANPADYCALCFDTSNNDTTPPEATDMKLKAKNTGPSQDEYTLFYGDGVTPWDQYANYLNNPNTWPPEFEAEAEWPVVRNVTFEFKFPIEEAWGEPAPPDGDIAGFCVHAYTQAPNNHVWWPDNSGDKLTPTIEYCNFPDGYGNLTFHASPDMPDHLEYVAGDDQSGTVDTTLLPPLQMRVVNQTGGNSSGIAVNYTFETVPGGAAGYYFVESGQTWYDAVSDVHGIANATIHLGDLPGDYQINASSPLPGLMGPTYNNTLNATATVGSLASIEISPNPGIVQVTGNSALTIWANDSVGNGIQGLTVNVGFDTNPSMPGTNLGVVTDNMDGTYSCTYTAGQTASVTDIVNATSGAFWNATDINVLPGNVDTVEMSASVFSVSPTSTSDLTVWVNDSLDNGISGLTVVMTFDADNSGAGFGAVTDNLDGTYSCTYTAGATGGVTDTVRATESGSALFDTVDIDVNALPLASIEMSASLWTVQVTGTSALTIWANDTGGGGVSGQTIIMSFDADNSGAGLGAVTDNLDGTYSCTYTAGQTAWVTDIVRAASGGFADTADIDVEAGPVFSISYVSGNGQSKEIDLDLDNPFMARVEDQYGNDIPGVNVDWTIDNRPAGSTGQQMTPVTNATDANGLSGSILTLGDLAGWYFVNATTAGLPGEQASFSAEATYTPAPAIMNITIDSGNNQIGTAGTMLAQSLIVEVMSGASVAGAGISVWFNVTSGGGSVDAGVVTTDAQGKARTNLTLGVLAGPNSVSAEISSSGTSQVTFNAVGTLPEIVTALAANVTKISVGATFIYLISYENVGTEAAADVWVNDTLPTGLQYVLDTSGTAPAVSGNSYSWHFASVSVGPHSFVMTCRVLSTVADSTVISNSISIDYRNMAGVPMPSETSNTVDVTALSDAGDNVPPIIDGVPDLTVHYDWDYSIDLTPYITDPDSDWDELFLISTETAHVKINPYNHLGLIINYSEDFLGIPQTLNITVSDGLGSDWDIIIITVTDDFPPEIVQELPDVTMYEDTVYYPFNITEYFFDRDGDAVFYSTGQKHISVEFLWNGTVKLEPDPDWFGNERITFRATSGTLGALVEDSIIVTVMPVNDPPVILPITNQTGEVDIAWLLDLSAYITDIDNSMGDLIITTDSSSVIVNGLNLTFRFASPTDMDIVTVTVSDGDAEVYRQIYVTVTAPEVGTADFPVPPWAWPIIIVVFLVVAGILLAYRRRRPVVEQVFLIYKDGAMLAHAANRMIPDMDSEIFTSMLTAIQDFVKDSFKDEKEWELKKLEFGDSKIFIDRAKSGNVLIALVYSGNDRRMPEIAGKTLRKVEESYGDVLKDWDGNLDKMRGSRDLLIEHAF